MPEPGVLLEREDELRAVDELLDAASAGCGHLLLVEGHAGIGKTALLDEAVARARAGGATVLRARASELESDFAFGVALQLFEPLLAGADDETRDRLLGGSAALAGPLLERPTSWGGDEGDDRSYSVIHGLFWLLSNLAEAGPVLVAIDDAHWADRTSLRLVLYLLQRLDDDERRDHRRAPARRARRPRTTCSARSRRTRQATRCARARSREAAAGAFVAATLPAAEDAFTDACWRMTEGNCFLLGELVRAVQAEGWEPTARNATRIGSLAPEAVLRAVAVRLMRLSDDAAGVARAVAILGEDAQLRHVAELTGRDAETAAAAADALAAGEILRPAGPGVLRFAHPLLASAVYADVGAGERATLHRRAAEILHERGHLVRARRCAPAAERRQRRGVGRRRAVRGGGPRAAAGAPESAASYLRRALEEPPGRRGARGRAAPARPSARPRPACRRRPRASRRRSRPGGVDRERAHALLDLGRARACNGRHAEALAAFEAAAQIADADAHRRRAGARRGGDARAAASAAPRVAAGARDDRRHPSTRGRQRGAPARARGALPARVRWPATRARRSPGSRGVRWRGRRCSPTRAAARCSPACRSRCTRATSSPGTTAS